MIEVKQDLRSRIIRRILEMKTGNEKCTPQPEFARAALASYHAAMPWLDLNSGVRDALKVTWLAPMPARPVTVHTIKCKGVEA